MNRLNWVLKIFIFITAIGCNSDELIPITVKHSELDPFKTKMAKSQIFKIEGKKDNIIEGKSGTKIVFPKGCFKNKKGNIVDGEISIELAEALTMSDMILSNLTTNSNGKLLQTDGMLYFNATQNGEQLVVNKENPIYIELPTKKRKDGMSAYRGVRDSAGNMNWLDPKPIESFLKTVDLNQLNFLPEHFLHAVEYGLPYKNHKIATAELADSLYYLLSVIDGSEFVKGIHNTNLNEPYYNQNIKVVKSKYTDDSYEVDTKHNQATRYKKDCGIDPAIIKTIKSSKFQNSLIATKEFEDRMKLIHKTCNQKILEIYTKNINRNMYELDSMATKLEKDDHLKTEFNGFYLQKKGKIKDADKYSKLLDEYYNSRYIEIKNELNIAKKELDSILYSKNKEVGKVLEKYREVLWKREASRMETYGFKWTETGWINVDKGVVVGVLKEEKLEVDVKDSSDYENVYSYILYPKIKSIYRLNTEDNKNFYVGNRQNRSMLMPKNDIAFIITVGYKGETNSLNITEILTSRFSKIPIQLKPISKEGLAETLNRYDMNEYDNSISEDLKYMEQFRIEQKRQKELVKESEFIKSLYYFVFSCCKEEEIIEESIGTVDNIK